LVTYSRVKPTAFVDQDSTTSPFCQVMVRSGLVDETEKVVGVE